MESATQHHSPGPEPDLNLEKTATLLAQVRAGDAAARERLVIRFLPLLQRWTSGRLPRRARDLFETDDLVQITLVRALDHLKGFEPVREGAFLAYLRQIVMNLIRDEIRRCGRRPAREELAEDLAEGAPSPLEEMIGRQGMEMYEAALRRLPEKQQQAVFLRLELGFTHGQVAEAIGSPSADAARMSVVRALLRLADEMGLVKP